MFLHPPNAPFSIDVTLLGMSIVTKSLHPEKAPLPIIVTSWGITVFLHPRIILFVYVSIIALQLPRESYLAFFSSTRIDSKAPTEEKAKSPICKTDLGIVSDFKLMYENAPLPIVIIPSDKVKSERLTQSANASLPIVVTEEIITL